MSAKEIRPTGYGITTHSQGHTVAWFGLNGVAHWPLTFASKAAADYNLNQRKGGGR